MQLISVVHDFASAFNKQLQIDAVFLDLSKEFDRVLHSLPIERLKEIGRPYSLIDCITAHLNNYM